MARPPGRFAPVGPLKKLRRPWTSPRGTPLAHGTRRLATADRAELGPSGLILLIAALFAAAITVSAILVSVHGLAAQGGRSARDAEASTGLAVRLESAAGTRPRTTGPLTTLELNVRGLAAEHPLPLATLVVAVQTPMASFDASYVDGDATAGLFNATAMRDRGAAFSTQDPYLEDGDLVRLDVNLTAGPGLDPGTDVRLRLLPLAGSPAFATLHAPAAFGSSLRVELG